MGSWRNRVVVVSVTLIVIVCIIIANASLIDKNLIWHDEFDGTQLDLAKWNYRALGQRRDAVNAEGAVAVSDGCLSITTYREGNVTYTGMIGTQDKFERTHGFYECRVRFQTQIGHWSAFWLQSGTFGEVIGDTNVSGAEIDIFEYRTMYPDTIQHTVHWDGYEAAHKASAHYYIDGDLSLGWHTVALEWTPEQYIFYVDGNETWRTTEGVSGAPQYIILSLEVSDWAGDLNEAALPDSVLFDYIRVYTKKPNNY